MSTVIYHDEDANLETIRDDTVAILGFGNQGSAQARNLRDSGLKVIVGNIDDAYRTAAVKDGFEVRSIAEASARAAILFLLVPDEIMPDVYERDVVPHLSPGKLLTSTTGTEFTFGA